MSEQKPLYVGAMNDGLFIIDKKPRSGDGFPSNNYLNVNVIAKMTGNDPAAQDLAKQFAAAPEMLAACQGALLYIDTVPIPDQVGEELRRALARRRQAIVDALAKAEGRS